MSSTAELLQCWAPSLEECRWLKAQGNKLTVEAVGRSAMGEAGAAGEDAARTGSWWRQGLGGVASRAQFSAKKSEVGE